LAGFINEDYDALVHHFIELADPGNDFDEQSFRHDITNAMAPFVGLRLAQMRSGPLLWELAGIAARHGAPLPRELILFLRTLASFEGIGCRLNPNFDMIATCSSFTDRIVEQMYSLPNIQKQGVLIGRDLVTLMRYAPRQLRALLRAGLDGDLRLQIASHDMRRVAVALDRSSSRMAVSLIVGALLISSSILVFARGGEQFFNVTLLGLTGFALAGVFGLYIVYSMISGRGGKL